MVEKRFRKLGELVYMKIAEQHRKRSIVLARVLSQGQWRVVCMDQSFLEAVYLDTHGYRKIELATGSVRPEDQVSIDHLVRAIRLAEYMAIFSQASGHAYVHVNKSKGYYNTRTNSTEGTLREKAQQSIRDFGRDLFMVQRETKEARHAVSKLMESLGHSSLAKSTAWEVTEPEGSPILRLILIEARTGLDREVAKSSQELHGD
ncbi:hypothetical protein MMC30_008165 [Trapelia coarctata]|nr:hypothetical protein [Trapelia coarctata]